MARASRTCLDCPTVITPGNRCTTCTARRRAASDATRRADGNPYGAAHRRFRTAVLARDPICVLCRQRWATVADHHPDSRRDLIANGQDPNDPKRGRGLCKPCHDRETARHQPGGWRAAQLAARGGGDPR